MRRRIYTKRITVALTEAQRASLEATAAMFGCDISDVVRQAAELVRQKGDRLLRFEQCDCGGWRPQTFSEGKWRWSSGCRPCNEIRLLTEKGFGTPLLSPSEDRMLEGIREKLRRMDPPEHRTQADLVLQAVREFLSRSADSDYCLTPD